VKSLKTDEKAVKFKTFGPDHLIILVSLAGLCGLVMRIGKRLTGLQGLWMARALGAFLLGYVLAAYTRSGMIGGFSWQESLPLHLCNWVLAACVITLFRPTPLLSEIAYFWGLAGTLQALITPDLREGFPSWAFFQFFWGHGGIFLAIIFDIVARDFRPRRGSVLRMFAAINFYALVAGVIDFLFGLNYGYLRHGPFQPSLIDHLGPWPWYILSMEIIVLASFWALDLPWKRGRPSNGSMNVGN